MNRRETMQLALLAALLLPISTGARCRGQQFRASETDVYLDAARFFTALLEALDPLANAIDRERFHSELTSLGNNFERMVTDKRQIATLLKGDLLDTSILQLTVARLKIDVELSVKRLTNVSFLLKQKYQEDGSKIAAELRSALLEQKSWLLQLYSLRDRIRNLPNSELTEYARQANASADALSDANTELAKLIERTAAR